MKTCSLILLSILMVFFVACRPSPSITGQPTKITVTATASPAASVTPLMPPTQSPQSEFVSPTTGSGTGNLLEGGSILSLLIDPVTPATLYALTNAGVIFKSTNSGGHWNIANHGLNNTFVGDLVFAPSEPAILYAATNGAGIFKTEDGGSNWEVVNTELSTNEFTRLLVHPLRRDTLFAYVDGKLYKSADRGVSWYVVNVDLSQFSIHTLAADPGKADRLYAGTHQGLLVSTDGGDHWRQVNTGFSEMINTLAIDPATPANLYAGTDHGVFKSTDSGQNWLDANTGLNASKVFDLVIDPERPAFIYASTRDGGVFRSTNSGENWNLVATELASTIVTALAIDPQSPATLYAGTIGGGVYRSANGGEHWEAVNTGLSGSIPDALLVDKMTPTTLYAGTWGGGVYKSTDGGGNWRSFSTGLTNPLITVLVIDPQTPTTLYAGTDGSGLFKSTDGGSSWEAISTDLKDAAITALVIDPLTPANLYAGSYRGMIKSTNGGESWYVVNNGLTGTDVYALAIDPMTPTTLYVATYRGGVFKTTNGGKDWAVCGAEFAGTLIRALVIDPFLPSTLFVGTEDGGFRSIDNGESWSAINAGLPEHASFNFLAIDPVTPGTIYGTTRDGVFKSSNSGESWGAFNTGVADGPVTVLAVDPSDPTTLHVGTWGGRILSIQADGDLNPILVPTLTTLPSTPTAVPSSTPSGWQGSMDTYGRIIFQDTPLAGMTLGVQRQGEPDWIKAYGFADLEGSIPASADTVYQIGSLSMPFTAAAVLQLKDRGQLDLFTPISLYLDGLPPRLQSFTLHQLLTHTSLIYGPAIEMQEKYFGGQIFTAETLFQELVPSLQISSPDLQDRFSYGNYILAGLIVEKVSGLSYSDYLNQYVIAPAGLQHTSYCLPPPAEMARGYYIPGTGFEPLQLNISAVFAAGGLCSTVGDLLLWMDALAAGKVVSPEAYQQMIMPAQLPDGTTSVFGYGMFIFQDEYGTQFGIFGAEASYTSFMFSDPQKGYDVVLLSNTGIPGNNLFEMTRHFIYTSLP